MTTLTPYLAGMQSLQEACREARLGRRIPAPGDGGNASCIRYDAKMSNRSGRLWRPRPSQILSASALLAVTVASACILDWERDEDAAGSSSGGNTCGDTCTCEPGKPCSFECYLGSCNVLCNGATTCDLSCFGGNCEIDCNTTGDCTASCAGGNCNVACPPGATCAVDCLSNCHLECFAGATCTNTCSSNCDVTCADSATCTQSCLNNCSLDCTGTPVCTQSCSNDSCECTGCTS